jgi:hypothetical protein
VADTIIHPPGDYLQIPRIVEFILDKVDGTKQVLTNKSLSDYEFRFFRVHNSASSQQIASGISAREPTQQELGWFYTAAETADAGKIKFVINLEGSLDPAHISHSDLFLAVKLQSKTDATMIHDVYEVNVIRKFSDVVPA